MRLFDLFGDPFLHLTVLVEEKQAAAGRKHKALAVAGS